MVHRLGGFYDLPHVQRFNQQVAKARLDEVGAILGANNADFAGLDVIAAIVKLAGIVGIPKSLRELGERSRLPNFGGKCTERRMRLHQPDSGNQRANYRNLPRGILSTVGLFARYQKADCLKGQSAVFISEKT